MAIHGWTAFCWHSSCMVQRFSSYLLNVTFPELLCRQVLYRWGGLPLYIHYENALSQI